MNPLRIPLPAICCLCIVAVFAVGPCVTSASLNGPVVAPTLETGPDLAPHLSLSELVSLRGGSVSKSWLDTRWVKIAAIVGAIGGFTLCVVGGLIASPILFFIGAPFLGFAYVTGRMRAGY